MKRSLFKVLLFPRENKPNMIKNSLVSVLLGLTLMTPGWAKDVLVPLDDRPANRLFVEQIARIGQPAERLVSPPRQLLGRLFTAGQSDAIADWTFGQVRSGDTVFLSADMWLYGGLVASRSAAADPEKVERRLARLRELSEKGVKVYVLATIPRLSLRTSNEQAPHETALAQWAAKAELPSAEEMLAAPEDAPFPEKVPREVVEEYLRVRVRNVSTLLALIDMAEHGVFESLVLGQDDANKTGLHQDEQRRLREAIAKISQTGGGDTPVTLLSGIDELTMNMVAGVLTSRVSAHPTVRVIYSDPEAAAKIPPLESLPLEVMIADHLTLAGARELDSPEADVDLFIYVPSAKPWGLPGEEKRPESEAFVATVQQAMAGGRRVAVADLSLVNRMDPFLAESVLDKIHLPELQGFASWNTPANAVGTVISQLACHRLAETQTSWKLADRLESEKTHQAFLFARMIDDYGYQTLVRDAVKSQVEGLSSGADPLLNLFGPVGLDIRLRLIEYANKLFAEHYLGKSICLLPQKRQIRFRDSKLEVVLPWPRVFEVEARLDLRLEDTKLPCARP